MENLTSWRDLTPAAVRRLPSSLLGGTNHRRVDEQSPDESAGGSEGPLTLIGPLSIGLSLAGSWHVRGDIPVSKNDKHRLKLKLMSCSQVRKKKKATWTFAWTSSESNLRRPSAESERWWFIDANLPRTALGVRWGLQRNSASSVRTPTRKSSPKLRVLRVGNAPISLTWKITQLQSELGRCARTISKSCKRLWGTAEHILVKLDQLPATMTTDGC